jgi:hypothetical protein
MMGTYERPQNASQNPLILAINGEQFPVYYETLDSNFNNDFTAEASSLYEILEAIPPESLPDDARAKVC